MTAESVELWFSVAISFLLMDIGVGDKNRGTFEKGEKIEVLILGSTKWLL